MKRITLSMLVLLTLAFGFTGQASANTISFQDGRSFSSVFGNGSISGNMLSSKDIAALLNNHYGLMLFSAYSSATNKVYQGSNLLYTAQDTRNGYIGQDIGADVLLSDIKINSYALTDAANYGAGKRLQAFVLTEDTTINSIIFGSGSLFFGFEDGINFIDFDYNDIVLAFRTPPVVPVPAAAWLLGTGLTGLVALRRKNSRA